MKEETRKTVENLIKLNNITNPEDNRIETCIADSFPKEYATEQEYISFQVEIAKIIKGMGKKETMKRSYTMYEGLISWYTKGRYKDLMQSSDEQGKGDVIEVPTNRNNLLDALFQLLAEEDINPKKLSTEELLAWGKKLEYVF